MNFSSFSVKALATSMLLVSTTGLAFAKHYNSYKGEANYKGEVATVPCPAPVMLLGGWYVGAQAGYDSYRVRESFDSAALGLFGNPVVNATGWVGGLFLGYGQYWDLFYLGAEIFGNVSNAEGDYGLNLVGGPGLYSQFDVRGSYGINIIPGIRLNNTSLGYVKLGWNWANFRGRFTDTVGGIVSERETSNGFNWGVGIETLLWDAWSVRTEYDHTYYRSFSDSGSFGSASWKPADNQFTVGLLYHFG